MSTMCVTTRDDESASLIRGWNGEAPSCLPADEWPRLEVRLVEGISVVDVLNAEALFDPGAIRDLSIQLHHLIEDRTDSVAAELEWRQVHVEQRAGHSGRAAPTSRA